MKPKYVWKHYTQKDMDVLSKFFKEYDNDGVLPFNPFYNKMQSFKVWWEGIDKRSKDLKDLIDGTFKYEDLPLWVPVKNEYFQAAVRWRFKIGK